MNALSLAGITALPTISYGGTGAGLDGEGRITQVTASAGANPVTGVSYELNGSTTATVGALTQVTLGSSDFDSFQYDPATGRMTQFKNAAGTSQSVIGNLGSNSDGTLASLGVTDTVNSANSQNCLYGYDDLARLASVDCGTSIWKQNFSYDLYGNITKTVPTGATGISFASTYSSTTSATNRLTLIGSLVPTYDTNGNLTNDRCTPTPGTPKARCSPLIPRR